MGGTSVLHGMMYMRGHPSNYDEYASMGNVGWGYDDVLPYFLKSEDNLDFDKISQFTTSKVNYIYT